jgi:hypothetical protein
VSQWRRGMGHSKQRRSRKEKRLNIPKEEPALKEATAKVCRACLESNLTSEIIICRCTQCAELFCIHFSSNIDPSNCTECLSDISLHKEVVTKTYERYNEETEEVSSYKRRARSIRLEGMHWLFFQRKILQMSDDALELAIEYHREILLGMLSEREERKTKFLHRFANVKFDPSIDTSTKTVVKTTKTISSSRAASTANAMMQALLAQGFTIEKITEMIEKVGRK